MYKMLLLEDDPLCSSEINRLLINFCNLHITSSPSIALHLATANKYNLIMININKKSGMTVINIAQSISNLSNCGETPIVAYTILKSESNKEYLLSYGFTHFISEPFNTRNFAQHIKFILSSQINNNESQDKSLKMQSAPKLVY